jgi:hypothetical protein
MENYQIAIVIKDNKVLCLKDQRSLYRPTPWMVPYKKVNSSFMKDNNGKRLEKQISKKADIEISYLTKFYKNDENNAYEIFVYQYVKGNVNSKYVFFELDDLYSLDFDSDFTTIYEFIFELLTTRHYVLSLDNKLYSSKYNNKFLIDMFDDVDIIFDQDTSLLETILKSNEIISCLSNNDSYSCLRLFKDGKLDNCLFA